MYLKKGIEITERIYNRGLDFLCTDALLYLCFDVETTGLDPENGAEVIELAWKFVDYNHIIDSIDILDSGRELFYSKNSKNTLNIHGIQECELEGLEPFDSSNSKLKDFIKLLNQAKDDYLDLALMGQYLLFDISFIEKYLGIEFTKDFKIFDTRAAEIKIDPNGDHSLGYLKEKYEIELDGQMHRADNDVDVTIAVAQKQLKLLKEMSV